MNKIQEEKNIEPAIFIHKENRRRGKINDVPIVAKYGANISIM
jgi:hypothetical protein